MNTYARNDPALGAHVTGRMTRAALGLGAAGTFLAGVWVSPLWIFAASVLSVYLVTTALLDRRVLIGPYESAGRDPTGASGYQRRLGHAWRLARGAAATTAMGSVLGDALIDAYMLDAFEIFVLNMGGVYLAMTTVAQDPVGALFTAGPPAAETAPPTGGIPGTGPVGRLQRTADKHAA